MTLASTSDSQRSERTDAAKEKRRMQTRLAQRRYRQRKRKDAAFSLEQVNPIINAAANHINTVYNHPTTVNLQDFYTAVIDRNMDLITGAEEMYKMYQNTSQMAGRILTNREEGTPSSSSSSSSPASSGSSSSSPNTDTAFTSYAPLPVNMSAMVLAAEKEGLVGMALTKHNKKSLVELMSTYAGDELSIRQLRMGEKVFLPQLDFYRAIFANAFALSFSAGDLGKCRVDSRIKEVWEHQSSFFRVPDNMKPVPEQLTIPHNIVLDLLPWPEVRRKALRSIQAGILDDESFKRDTFFGTDEDFGYQSPFLVHGVSANDDFQFNSTGAADITMDPESWQCSPAWLEKYWFLIDEGIVRRTNWWRRMQGLSPVVIRAWSRPVMPVRMIEM